MAEEKKNAVQQSEQSHSERFTGMVLKEFGSNVSGELKVTDYQRQLIQGYFIGVDRALQVAEDNRVRKNKNNKDHKWDNNLPVTWQNVNLSDLAKDVMHYARIGLDMMEPNHLSPVPYKNNKTDKYDITLMPGYNGIQYIAEKYATEKPVSVTIELVYSNDHFKPLKKSSVNKIESYEFEIKNAFDRGKILGGFGYIEYEDPKRNKLILMTETEILKRKPKHAAAEFWGGTSSGWEDGKKVEIEKDGWQEQMYLKTLKREVYSAKHIQRDPKKIDDNYKFLEMQELKHSQSIAQADIDDNANAIDVETVIVNGESVDVDTSTGEVKQPQKEAAQPVSGTAGSQGVMF